MIYLVLFLAIVAFVLKDLSLKYVLKNVSYSIESEKSVMECDEIFHLTTTLHNDKSMPVTFIKLSEFVPAKMWVERNKKQYYQISENGKLVSSTYLMPHQKYKRTFKASLPQRGRYFLHGAVLFGGDIFGLSETIEHISLMKELVVLPKPLNSGKIDTVMGGFIGDYSVNRFIMEDPILTIGFCEYTGREPMKHINWQQTLKASQMMVKNFDHTTELSATVILNIECGENGKEINSDLMETAFSLARYVCEYLENHKVKYSFMTNATAAGAIGNWKSVGEGLGNRHLRTILEGLGRATYDSTENFNSLLYEAIKNCERGRAHIIISPTKENYWQNNFKRLSVSCDNHILLLCAENYVENSKEEI